MDMYSKCKRCNRIIHSCYEYCRECEDILEKQSKVDEILLLKTGPPKPVTEE